MTEQELAETGLSESLARLHDHGDSEKALIPLAEVLSWLYALENLHRSRLGDELYFRHRRGDREGQALAGLMYARGLVAHQMALVGVLFSWPSKTSTFGGGGRRGGSTIIVTGGGSTMNWKPLSDLPEPGYDEAKRKEDRRPWYREHVEGRLVVGPVEAAARFLIENVRQVV